MNGFYSSVAGATLRWHDFPGDGLPVVFIHGLGCASSYDYPRIASDPALRERRKILIDLPGFGYSDKPRLFSYNIHEQALVLEQFLSHLRLQRFALFGHSMGGSIAIEAAGLLGRAGDHAAGLGTQSVRRRRRVQQAHCGAVRDNLCR
ncbi:alpha/beta fold family hydrolase [Klebsiella pneumoniae]|uniref:Alpha/beta fold family hydrolase n=1 Tax=Klebsiella pneumoniae TaxID=573 RepID=A0A378B376_KLEPN|nr:alpha/beta fold family hydrolase [Klebsiella pneumoniae]